MKRLLLIVGCLLVAFSSFATHIAGGELFYQYMGPGTGNTDKFKITMRLFRQCDNTGGSGALLTIESPKVAIYNTNGLTLNTTLVLIAQFSGAPPSINNTPSANPCLVGSFTEVNACYQVGTWSAEIELPKSAEGYTLVWTRYTRRVTSMENVSISNDTGATFVTTIPGTNILTANNSSPEFVVRDSALVCAKSPFTLNYSAVDADGDSLAYSFAPAYDGVSGSSGNPDPFNASGPPAVLSLTPLTYTSPYTSSSPLGPQVTLNVTTGVLSGTAPTTPGYYVICIVVEEWRNGVKLNNHRKDFILKVGNCSSPKPNLGLDDRTCNGFNFTFSDSTTNAFTSYQWSFGDGGTSIQPQPSHTYTTAGLYTLKLVVTSTGGCQDSSTKQVYVFPGFVPKFTIAGSCYLNPYQFTNTTFTAYGVVDTTRWNFGDPNTLADTSKLANPTYQYPTIGTYPVYLYATNSKGCRKDTTIDLLVADKPQIQMPFRDTLICSIDTLVLHANANGGSYSWTPNTPNIMLNPNSANPSVFPKDTTMFIVSVNNNGCINKDTVIVNVLDFIDVNAGVDTGICLTDTFRLHTISHALSYLWTSSTGENVDDIKYPLVQPLVHTTYYVKANLGKCQDSDSVYVKVAPYPKVTVVDAGPLCFGNSVQLNASIVGSAYSWSPTTNILNANTLTPTVNPTVTTSYILSVTDTVGCPKPVKDTVKIFVIPPVTAFAGKDTSVVINQPLQLFVATNAALLSPVTHFQWTPNFGLNKDTIQNPIATINTIADSIKYHVTVTTADGCIGEDEIVVKVYKTEPDIFVPTAFTPNGDGRNEILKPICVGISRLDFFRVFNRWGQMIFETKEFDKGWDGRVSGTDQETGTYVFMAQGVDYTGKVVFRKGTVVLIR
jgi:gliding motility-associated-like protein